MDDEQLEVFNAFLDSAIDEGYKRQSELIMGETKLKNANYELLYENGRKSGLTAVKKFLKSLINPKA